MDNKGIDLGEAWEHELCCEPDATSTKKGKKEKPKKHYPSLYVNGLKNADLLEKLPVEGTLTIKYRIVSRDRKEPERDGKKKPAEFNMSMDVLKIFPPEEEDDNGLDFSALEGE